MLRFLSALDSPRNPSMQEAACLANNIVMPLSIPGVNFCLSALRS